MPLSYIAASSVECFFLKPCWCSANVIDSCRVGRIILSSNLAGGDKSEIGLKLVPSSVGLLGFNSGIIRAVFHLSGMMD